MEVNVIRDMPIVKLLKKRTFFKSNTVLLRGFSDCVLGEPLETGLLFPQNPISNDYLYEFFCQTYFSRSASWDCTLFLLDGADRTANQGDAADGAKQ